MNIAIVIAFRLEAGMPDQCCAAITVIESDIGYITNEQAMGKKAEAIA